MVDDIEKSDIRTDKENGAPDFAFSPAEGSDEKPAAHQAGDKITLVGPSLSGKTFMLAAIASAASVAEDAEIGPDSVEWCSFVFERDTTNPDSEKETNALRYQYEEILQAKVSESTRRLFKYSLGIAYREKKPASPLPKKGGIMNRKTSPAPEPDKGPTAANQRKLFELVDGRGGDLTQNQYADDLDAETRKFIQEHYGVLRDARGALICLPWRDNSTVEKADADELPDRDVDGLERLLKESSFVDASRLEHVAVCITKYELAFVNDGANANAKAKDRDMGLARLRDCVYRDLFKALRDFHNKRPIGRKTSIQVFPCSTFGFVNGKGASNYYPSKYYPGLLTRSLSRKNWQADPKLRDHFPTPISDAKASKMWHPFNLGSPLFFAATGKVTGPISFSLEELL